MTVVTVRNDSGADRVVYGADGAGHTIGHRKEKTLNLPQGAIDQIRRGAATGDKLVILGRVKTSDLTYAEGKAPPGAPPVHEPEITTEETVDPSTKTAETPPLPKAKDLSQDAPARQPPEPKAKPRDTAPRRAAPVAKSKTKVVSTAPQGRTRAKANQ
jgi:type IV secretory pathway VirB10-like protein